MRSPVVIIGIFIIALVVGIFWTWPAYKDYSALLREQKQKQAEMQTREEYINNLVALDTQLQGSKDKLAKLDAAFPSDEDLPSLYSEVQQLASASGLVLRSITSSLSASGTAASQLQTIELNLSLEGSYTAFKEFLLRTQTAWRVLDVQSIAFSSPKTGTTFNFAIKLYAYSY